jgi:hypothetical protein
MDAEPGGQPRHNVTETVHASSLDGRDWLWFREVTSDARTDGNSITLAVEHLGAANPTQMFALFVLAFRALRFHATSPLRWSWQYRDSPAGGILAQEFGIDLDQVSRAGFAVSRLVAHGFFSQESCDRLELGLKERRILRVTPQPFVKETRQILLLYFQFLALGHDFLL